VNTKPVRHVVRKAAAVAAIATAVLLAAPVSAFAGIQGTGHASQPAGIEGTGHAAHTAGVGGTGHNRVVSPDGISGGSR